MDCLCNKWASRNIHQVSWVPRSLQQQAQVMCYANAAQMPGNRASLEDRLARAIVPVQSEAQRYHSQWHQLYEQRMLKRSVRQQYQRSCFLDTKQRLIVVQLQPKLLCLVNVGIQRKLDQSHAHVLVVLLLASAQLLRATREEYVLIS